MSTASGINLTNQFLIAMPGMVDDNFAGTVVFLCEHTERGALGLVINRPIDLTVGHLFEKVDLSLDREELAERPVFFGGPVQTERGFVLHERQSEEHDLYTSSLAIPGRPGDDHLARRAGSPVPGGRPAEGVRDAGLQRLERRAAGRRTLAQRLAQCGRRARHHLRHPRGSSATSGPWACSASTWACSPPTPGTTE